MSKQTAVQWLVEQLKEMEYDLRLIPNTINQAKAMEKEQIIESYCQGCLDISHDENIFPRETSEDYFNKTYGSGNNL